MFKKSKARRYRRHDASIIDTLIRAPWWLTLGLSLLLAGFFWFAASQVHLPWSDTDRLIWMIDDALHAPILLMWLGWASMIGGLVIAGLSCHRRRLRKRLFDRQRDLNSLRAMSWQAFEQMVGEYFRRQGYKVIETGQGGADGGVDLMLRRGHEKVLVQCKRWKSTSVGAPVVREMLGLMLHHDASGVKIVSSGKFTREAVAFAEGKSIELIDGDALLMKVLKMQKGRRS